MRAIISNHEHQPCFAVLIIIDLTVADAAVACLAMILLLSKYFTAMLWLFSCLPTSSEGLISPASWATVSTLGARGQVTESRSF